MSMPRRMKRVIFWKRARLDDSKRLRVGGRSEQNLDTGFDEIVEDEEHGTTHGRGASRERPCARWRR